MAKLSRSSVLSWGILLLAGFFFLAAGMTETAEAAPKKREQAAPRLNVRSAILLDARTGKVLFEQNADARIPPASLTKVLSMMVALDHVKSGDISLKDKVRVSRNASAQGGSRMHIRKGERLSLQRLLMGMAVSSGNDASMAVAEHVSGSSKTFVRLMNAKARQLGMKHSVFRNPHGLPAKGQVTTARDMARLGYYYLKAHPKALSQYHRTRTLSHNGRRTTNKNPLLGVCPGADGLKTGWISASGYNIISTVRRGNTRLIAVVLGAKNSKIRGVEVARMIESGFKAKEQKISVASALRKTSTPAYAGASVKKQRTKTAQKQRPSKQRTVKTEQTESTQASRSGGRG